MLLRRYHKSQEKQVQHKNVVPAEKPVKTKTVRKPKKVKENV